MSQELIMSTIKKVYAIRESIEKRTAARLSVPVIGYVSVALAGIRLTKDQTKDITAFVTASCNTADKLNIMEKISEFKTRSPVKKPGRVLFSYAGLLLPVALAVAAEAVLFYLGMLAEPLLLGVAAVMVIVSLAIGVLLYGFLGYDPEHRRDAIEHEIWKTIHLECQKRKKLGVKIRMQLPPAPQAAPPAPVARAPGAMKKL
jgi:hypothetical protein